MERFNLNIARAFIGQNVNLHLKDGSVLVNVLILDTCREKYTNTKIIRCLAPPRKKAIKVPLKDVAWAERLNPHLLSLTPKKGFG